MPLNDPTAEINEPINRRLVNLFVVLAVLSMILCEAVVIHGLWFKGATLDFDYWLKRCSIPVFVAFPALFLSTFGSTSRRWARQGQMTSSLAASINVSFGVVTMITYICILDLAELAFRAR